MSHPSDAVRSLHDLVQWVRSPSGRRFYTANPNTVKYSMAPGEQFRTTPDEAHTLENYAAESLFLAVPYFVSADIADVLYRASLSLPSWHYEPSQLPSRYGWVHLDGNIDLGPSPASVDYYDSDIVSAISWAVVPADPRHVAQENAPTDDRDILIISGWRTTANVKPTYRGQLFRSDGGLLPCGLATAGSKIDVLGAFRESFSGSDDRDVEAKLTPSLRLVALLATLLAFMQQRIVASSPSPVPRSVRRQLERSGSRPPDLRVIALRRRAPRPGEPEAHSEHSGYSCQWLVSGHWHKYWYPSLGVHQPRWVRGYVKGPTDKPLRISDPQKVFAVVR